MEKKTWRGQKRWRAEIHYFQDETPEVWGFDEFAEFGDIVEEGPDWNEIEKIEIRYQLEDRDDDED